MTDEANLPSVSEVVVELERALSGDRTALPNSVLSLILELHDSNLKQWDLEDATRTPDATDAVIADAKRAIDRLNLDRHHLIEDIDEAVRASLQQSSTAPFATESPAMVYDRLSVLVIRIARTRERAQSDADDAGAYAVRLPSLERQLVALSAALESLMGDVRAGTRRFIPYEQLKLYASSQHVARRRGRAGSSPG